MPTVFQRHRARRLAVWNGAIWALGNGLAGTTLIIYLARELHAERLGLHVSLILAAPHIVGLLRITAPAMIGQLADRKRFCIGAFLGSAVLLLALPYASWPGCLPSPAWSAAALTVLWSLHHLMQYLGMVALWSWLADVAIVKVRGRFLGWRERWMTAATAVAAVSAGFFAWFTSTRFLHLPSWVPYGILALLGAGFMIVALIPLARMPAASSSQLGSRHSLLALLKPLSDARFLRLLLYGCWFSFSNGITQSAQRIFVMDVLQLRLLSSLAFDTGTRLGQSAISPRLGALADRLGNRPVMIVSQLLVAAALLCYAVATPAQWLWVGVAAALWVAYAGLNVCLPNLMLKVAPPSATACYVATFEGARGLCYAASTILGGLLVDYCRVDSSWAGLAAGLPVFAGLFIAGWAVRSVGALLLLLVIEPSSAETDRALGDLKPL